MRNPLLCCPIALSLAFAAAAQTADTVARDASSRRSGVGLHRHEDRVAAIGPDYTARFDAAGFEYTPLLGAAPAAMPLRVTLATIRRGNELWFARGDRCLAPAIDGLSVTFRHATVIESYDVRPDGIEQRFELAERPVGSGDLVVRLALTTTLQLTAADEQNGLRYEAPGIGGVSIGGVTAVDANGARVGGRLRAAADHVEYVLPAEFVDAAQYPLVIDPLFGSAFQVGNAATGTDDAADVAFDETALRWLVVWRVAVSATQAEVRGQLVSYTGALLGGQLLLAGNARVDLAPKVVDINHSNRFLVAFATPAGTVDVRAVDAATGAMSSTVTAVSGPAYAFALGGDMRDVTTADAALLVSAENSTAFASVRARRVRVLPTGSPLAQSSQPIAFSLDLNDVYGNLAVTRHCGSDAFTAAWGVTYSWSGGSAPFADLSFAAVDQSGSVTASEQVSASPATAPTVATIDASRFAVAWTAPSSRLALCTVTRALPFWVVSTPFDPVQANGFSAAPSLDFAENKFVLAWRQSNLLTVPRVMVKSLDLATCAPCSTEATIESSPTSQNRPAVGARWSGGVGQDDTSLVVWDSGGAIRARRYEATGGGSYANLGGGCGTGGGNVVGFEGQPVLGDSTFALTLSSPTAPVIWAIVGLSELSAPCGTCTIVPALDFLLNGPGPHPIPIPCDTSLIGFQLWTQWVLLAPGGCPLAPFFALSPALRFTIGQ